MKDKMMAKIKDIEGQIERKKKYVGFLINSIADHAHMVSESLEKIDLKIF